MSTPNVAPGTSMPVSTRPRVVPSRTIGWWALALSLLALVSWIALPSITMAYRDTYPITDTALMPVIAVVLTDSAAVLNLLAVFRWKERSLLNIIATIVMVVAGVFFTFMLVGEAIAAA